MLKVRVLGGLELELDGRRLMPPAGRPPRALLAWLAVHPGSHPRATVAAALWPDVLDESARASLRTALAAVRQALGPATAALSADRNDIGLIDAWIDVREFDRALQSGALADAVALSRGELLPELDPDWVLRERDRHRDRLGAALGRLAADAAAAGERDAALDWLRRRTELDPFDEHAHRELIAALADGGDRAGAIATYGRLAARLRRELAVAPSGATRSLVARLRAEAPQRRLPARLEPGRWRRTFVGRADALARLGRTWADVQPGGIMFAVITGEPGIGKTRLAARFAAELHGSGATVLSGRAEPDSLAPYQAITEALGADVAATEPERLAVALEEAAAGRPMVVVLDDLHWADPDTLAFLRRVVTRGLATPTLVIATARAGELDPRTPLGRALAAAGRDTSIVRVELGGFSRSEAAAFVADHEWGAADDEALERLLRRTGGNPFLLGALVDSGLPPGPGHVPTGVPEVVAARLETLGASVVELFEAAAILGPEFDSTIAAEVAGLPAEHARQALDAAASARLVVAVADRHAFVHALVHEALATRPGPGRLAELHARAVAALEPRASGGSSDALVAAARHALAALPALGAAEAAGLALRAGAAMRAAHAPADAAALLAEGAALAERHGTPVALRAELHAMLGDALHVSDRPGDAEAEFASALMHARRSGDGQLLARVALGAVGEPVTILRVDPEKVDLLEEALSGLPATASSERARVEARLAAELAYDPDPRRRDELSASALAAARAHPEPRTLTAALGARHIVLWGPDHTHERLALADEMVDLARRAQDPALELQARTWRIVDLNELGDGAAIDAELDAYAATAARSGLSAYGWYVPAWRAVRASLAGRYEDALALQRQAMRLGQRAGDANVQFIQRLQFVQALADERPDIDMEWQSDRIRNSPAGWAYRAMYTWALAASGREALARAELSAQRANGAPRSWPRDTNWLSAAKELSEAAFILRDLETAAELEQLLKPFADRTVASARATMMMGSVAGALARLAELRGARAEAIDRYRQATAADERAGSLIWATHHRRRLGENLIASGAEEEGRQLLTEVMNRAPAMGLWRVAQLAGRNAKTVG